MVFTLAGLELRRMFLSPLAWTVLAVVQFIVAYLFLTRVDLFLQVQGRLAAMDSAPGLTDIIVAPALGNSAVVLLLVAPLLTMRLVSEERRSRTLSLLLSAPVSMTEIILGKYLGMLAFFGVMLLLITAMTLSLLAGGTLDFGMLATGLLGLGLLMASFAALGLFISTLTEQPTVAAVGTFGVLLLLWVLDWAGQGSMGETGAVFAYLSLLRHFQPLLQGVVDSRDLIYFVLFIATFLALGIRRLDAERLQG